MSNKIDFTTFGSGNYSLNEQNTGFTWIDGNIIYKKTIDTGQLPNNTTKYVAHGISNLDVVIKVEAIAYRQTPGQWQPLPLVYEGSDSAFNCKICVSSTNVELGASQDRTAFGTSYTTIYYTKTS